VGAKIYFCRPRGSSGVKKLYTPSHRGSQPLAGSGFTWRVKKLFTCKKTCTPGHTSISTDHPSLTGKNHPLSRENPAETLLSLPHLAMFLPEQTRSRRGTIIPAEHYPLLRRPLHFRRHQPAARTGGPALPHGAKWHGQIDPAAAHGRRAYPGGGPDPAPSGPEGRLGLAGCPGGNLRHGVRYRCRGDGGDFPAPLRLPRPGPPPDNGAERGPAGGAGGAAAQAGGERRLDIEPGGGADPPAPGPGRGRRVRPTVRGDQAPRPPGAGADCRPGHGSSSTWTWTRTPSSPHCPGGPSAVCSWPGP